MIEVSVQDEDVDEDQDQDQHIQDTKAVAEKAAEDAGPSGAVEANDEIKDTAKDDKTALSELPPVGWMLAKEEETPKQLAEPEHVTDLKQAAPAFDDSS